MRAANIPMELVGNVARRRHIQQRKRTLTPKQKKVDEYNFLTIGSRIKTRLLSRDRHNMAQPCMGVVIIRKQNGRRALDLRFCGCDTL